jgi:rhamnulose-1-phosphate aldolase
MRELVKQIPALENQILEISEIAQYLWEKGWAEHNAGNISLNISDLISEHNAVSQLEVPSFKLEKSYPELATKYFFVTATGKRMRDLARLPMENALIIRVNAEGDSYSIISKSDFKNYPLQPTSELPAHLAIHQFLARRHSKEKVVIHTHATELIALTQNEELKNTSAINNILWGMHPETIIFVPKGVGFVPYCLPGSDKIATETIRSFQNHDIVLWEKHGVFAIGENVSDTFDTIDIICKSAAIYFMCKSAGFNPEGFAEKQLAELKKLAGKFSGS